jgi:hypothetical protein
MIENNKPTVSKRVLDFSPASFNTGMEGSQYKRDLSPFEKSQDVLASSQGFWDASGNFLANIVGSTAINTAGLGASLYGVGKAIGTGEFKNIWDNELSQGLDKVQKGLDEITPFYNSEKEDKAGLFSTDYLTSAGFWGNTVGKGVSFIAGAYLGGASLAKGGSMALKGMSRASKSFGKLVNGEEATSGLINAAKQGNIPGWIERAGKSSTIKNAASFYAQKISGNMFEAGMEAKGVKEEILRGKEEEYAKLHPSAPVAPEWLKKEWDEDSSTFGNVAFGLNMLLLQIDGLGLNKTMYGYKTTKRSIEAAKDAAGKFVELSAKRKMLNKAGRIIGGGLEEAAQEGGQFIVEKTSTELGVNDKAKNFADYVNAGFKGLEQTLGTKEGQESMLAGFLLGGGGRAVGELKGATERNLQNKIGIEALNKYMLKDTIKPLVDLAGKSFDDGSGQILENATEVNDKKLFHDTKAKDFFNWASTRIEMGRYEDAVDELTQLKNTPVDVLDGIYPNHNLTEAKKHMMFDGLLNDMKDLNSMQSDVEINFGNSPYKKNILNTAYRIKNIDRRIKEMSTKDKSMLDIYHDEDLQNLLAEKEELSRDLAILMMTRPKPSSNTQEEKTAADNTDTNKALAPTNNTPTSTPDDIVSKQERKENSVGTKIPGMGVITNINNNIATIKDEKGNITHEELDNLPNEAFDEKIFTPEPTEDDEENRMLPDYKHPDTKKKDVSFVDPEINTEDPNYQFSGKEEFVQVSDFGLTNLDKMDGGLSESDAALVPEITALKEGILDKQVEFDNLDFNYSQDDSGRTSVTTGTKGQTTKNKIGYIPNINTQLAGNAKEGSKRSILQFMMDYFNKLAGTNRKKNKNSFIPVIQGIRSLLEKAGLDITPYMRPHSRIRRGVTQLNEVLQSPRFLVQGKLAMSFFKDGIYQPDPSLPKDLQDLIKTQLQLPHNQNNLGTQYVLMVERPGQKGVYTFIGVKGRKLSADEKQAYATRIAENPQGVVQLLNKELFISSEGDQIQGNDGKTYPLHYEFDRYEEKNANGEVTKAGKLYVKRFIKGTIDNSPIKDKRRSTISIQEALDRASVRTAPTVDEAFTPENLAKLQINTDKQLFDLYFQFDAKKFVAEHPLEFNEGDIINKAQQESDEKKVSDNVKYYNTMTNRLKQLAGPLYNSIKEKIKTFQENGEKFKFGKETALLFPKGQQEILGNLLYEFEENFNPETNEFPIYFYEDDITTEQPPVNTGTKAGWANNLSSIKNELSKLKNKEEKLQWLADNNYLDPFTQDGKTSNYLRNATGRVITKIKIGNITIPFYISTGQGGKTDVEVDKWYVFFGQGNNGWFNKTSGPDMNKQYGVKIFQDIANILNEVGSKKDEYKVHQDSKGFMDLKWTNTAEDQLQTVIDFITPVQPTIINGELRATPEQIIQLKQNIQTVKDRVTAELTALENKQVTQQPTEDNKLTVNVAKQIETALLNNVDIDNIVDRVKDAKEIIAAFDWALKSFPESVISEFVKGSISARDQLLSQVRSFIKQNEQPTQEPEVIIVGKAKIIKNSDGTYAVLDENDEVMLEGGTIEEANQAAKNINDFDELFGQGNTQGKDDLDPDTKAKLLKEIEETAPEEKEKILREVAVFENELARILPGIKVNIDFTKGHSYYRNAVITLTSGQVSRAKWHEAFHAIFDCFSPEEKNRAIRIAAENFAINPTELLMYKTFYDELYNKELALFQSKQTSKEPKKLTEEELVRIMYEEKIADLFQDYMENRPVERGLFQRFFDAIAKFIMHILGRTDEAPFTALFDSINRGDFANRNPNLGQEGIKLKLPNSSSAQSRQLVANLGVQTIQELRDSPRTDVGIFIKGQIEKYRTMYSNNISAKITDLKKKLVSGSITKEQLIEQVRILTNTRQIIDINNLYPPMLAAENETLIIDAVKKFGNLTDKYEVELEENDEDNTEAIKNLSLMESNMDELIEAQAVQQRISYLHYLDESGMVTAVDGKSLYDNLKMNLEGLENEQFIPVLEKLASSKKETPYTKSMKEFLKLFKADQTFRTQCYNAFSNYFVPSYSSKIDIAATLVDEETGKSTRGFESKVYANNAENYVETQMDTWRAQLFGKTLERIESPEDLLKYITIQDEVFDSPAGIPLIESLINSINNKLATRTSVDIINMITTGKDNITLQKLAAENIQYRMDLGDLTYKFGGKNFYSMLKQNYVFKQLKNSEKYKGKWGVFTGVNFRLKTDSKAEQELYKEIDPATYFLTNLQLYGDQDKNGNSWYIPQQMENKSTVVIVKGKGKSKTDLSPAITEEITRQTALIDRYIKELKSGKSLIKGFHTYDKVPAEIKSLKNFANTPEFISSLIEKGVKRELLPRAYQYINIVGANETLSTQKPTYNESLTLNFIRDEVLDIKDIITELGLPDEILAKTLKIGKQEDVNKTLINFAISQYLNRMEMLAAMNPELTKYKDFVDITKRGAGLLLAGPSHYNADRPATFGTVVLKDVEYTINKNTMERDSLDGLIDEEEIKEKKKLLKEIKATDGQSIETIGRRLDRHLRLGRASEDPNNDFYKKAEILQAYKDDDRAKIAELDSGDMALMVDKTGGFDGKKYIKTSIFPLTRSFTSMQVPAGTEGAVVDTYNGKSYLPYPHRIESYNQFNKLQALEVEVTNTKRASGEIKKTDNIYFEAHFASAIKLGLTDINPLDAEKYEYSEYNNADYRLQQENPSGKDEIKDGTQLIQLIGAFLPDDIQFSGDFKEYIGPNARQEILKDMSRMLADLREFDRRMIPNAFKKLQLLGEKNGGIYVPFIKYLQDSKETSSGSDNDSEFLASKDGEFIYSQNMPNLINGYEQAFISYFNKNLFSQKTPGGKATLVAATYSEVMELNGEVISTWEFENKLTAEERAQVTTRPLKCHKPSGNLEDTYAEVVLSEEYLEDILDISLEEYHNLASEMKEKVKTILGFRIPTQSHHSMMPCKVVDFAPRHYGSIVIAPAEITYLSGADYDVDSLFFQRYGFYKNKEGKLGQVQLDANTYFSTIMDNKIVKDYMKMNNPELDVIKVDIAKNKAAVKAYNIKLREYETNPPSNLELIKSAQFNLAEAKSYIKLRQRDLYNQSRQALTSILETLGFPTTEKEFRALDSKEKATFIKDYSNNSLLSTRLNILTSSFEGKFAPAIDKFQEISKIDEGKFAKYFPKAKESKIYTSFVTFFKHYLNNYSGGRAIGASANGNKVFANLHATNSTISETLKGDLVRSINRELFTDTNQIYGVDCPFIEVDGKIRFGVLGSDSKADNLSSAVSMTVDNVKEQTLVKFNLNDKTMPLLTTAFGIGIGNNVMAAFLLNPITKLFSQTFMKKSSAFGEKGVTMRTVIAGMQTDVQTEYSRPVDAEGLYQINQSNLNDFLSDATEDTARKLEILTKFVNGDIKLQQLEDADKQFIERQFALLDLYSSIAEIAEDSFVINTLLNLNKELGEQSSDVDYVLARFDKAKKGDDPEGMPPSRFSFDYKITSSVQANINSVVTAKKLLDENLLFYGENMQELFKNVDNVCLGTPNSKSDFESRVEMKKEFLNFLTIRAYSRFNQSSMDINNLDLIKGGLVKMYEENKDAILKYPFGQMLKPLEPTRQYPFGRLGVDSFKKLDPRKKDDIMDSFAGMLIDPETKEFAIGLLSFIASHDNFRFLGQSAVSFMRPSIFNALNEIVKGTDSLDGVEEFFVQTDKGKVIDTQKVASSLTDDGNFDKLFKDYLSFWFSDNRNAKKLDKLTSKLLKSKGGELYIETKDIKNIPLVTFFSTEDGRVPVILEGKAGGKAYYKVIRRPKNGTSLKLYQLTNTDSANFIDSAAKATTPSPEVTAKIISMINSITTLPRLEGYIETQKTQFDALNDEIINALNAKRAALGNVTTTPTSTQPNNTNKPEFDKLPSKSATPTMTYAGIGSRQSPQDVLNLMTEAAKYLETKGYTLNTGVTFNGKEEGADGAFSKGTSKKNLFSPENQGSRTKEQTIAKEVHPNPNALSAAALKLMARNTNQVFGENLDTPVDFVLFYAKESGGIRPEGGTGQAVEMARRKGIPTINMADDNWRDQLKTVISKKTTKPSEVKPVVTQTNIPPVPTGKASFSYKNKEIATEFPLSQDQNTALGKLVDFVNAPSKDVITLEGAAGTGKTTIIGYLQKYFKDSSSFVYMAPTHAATAELAFATVKTGNNSLPATIQSSITTDKITKQPTFTVKIRRRLGINPVIVVDESSMLGEKEIKDLLIASKNNGVKVIFMGDEKQIPKVMPSAKDVKALSPAFTDFDKVSLQYVHRTSNQNILSLLSEMRNSKTFNVPRPAENTNSLQFLDNFIEFKQKFIDDLMVDPENTVMITYTNRAVKDYNTDARKAFGREGDPVVGDVITGYLGYASKQIEKKDIANSIQYTITGILNNGSAKVIQAESSRLKKLAESGIEVPHEATTIYYQLSRNDSFAFDDLTLDDYQNNNKYVSGIFRDLHNITQAFLNKQARYEDLLAAQASVSEQMRKISLGQNYIYNPKTDRMEIFDQMTHESIDSKLKVEKDIDYGHAITIHKSQGTTIGNVYFDLASVKRISDLKIVDKAGNIVTTEKQALAYVGLSRSKNKLIVFDGAGQVGINFFNEDEDGNVPSKESYTPTKEELTNLKPAFNPWGNIPPTGNGGPIMAKLNRSLFGLPEPQDAGPKQVNVDAVNIVIDKIKSNFALYKDVLGVENVEQLDNMNSSQVATLIKNFCKI